MRHLVVGLVLLALVGCGGGGGEGLPGTPLLPGVAPLLTAGTLALQPSSSAVVPDGLDLGAFQVDRAPPVYDLTTPAGEPFVFDLLCRRSGNQDPVRVSLAHALDGGASPAGGGASLAAAGFVLSAAGSAPRGPWLDAWGDGFARITVRGEIQEPQVLLAQATDGSRPETVLIRIAIGPASPINVAAMPTGDHPGVLDETTLYSSNAWNFGLPTIAVSGDRTSVLCYEGDLSDPFLGTRYEMRLQHDAATEAVTGGGSQEASPDSGNWRDHEIAALYNVLARVHGGTDAVSLAISFDRGATFAQQESWSSPSDTWRPRLVQVVMALDYTMAVLYWRTNPDMTTDLVYVEGRPSAYDDVASPTAYEFDDEIVVRHVQGDVTPALFGACTSVGGDLAVGYAYSTWESLPDMTWRSTTVSGCAVKPWGESFRDVVVEEDVVVGKDPSVALLGEGASLRVFYAWEGRDGVRLASSEDGGRTFSAPLTVADPSSHMPTVFAREIEGKTVVDVLYLAQADEGLELHVAHWEDWGLTPVLRYRLTRATMEDGGTLAPDRPLPGAPDGMMPPGYGFKITQVAWFGYDAVQDGEDLVVVVDEETFDGAVVFMGGPMMMEDGFGAAPGAPMDANERFTPVEPPPMAPGMTEAMPAPDPDHMHQLKLIRLR